MIKLTYSFLFHAPTLSLLVTFRYIHAVCTTSSSYPISTSPSRTQPSLRWWFYLLTLSYNKTFISLTVPCLNTVILSNYYVYSCNLSPSPYWLSSLSPARLHPNLASTLLSSTITLFMIPYWQKVSKSALCSNMVAFLLRVACFYSSCDRSKLLFAQW